MSSAINRSVDIIENGRYGSVAYRESAHSLAFYWEFGGGDAVAIIQVEDRTALQATWIGRRQAGILRFVADEVIRQKAPDSRAEIDEAAGCITLRQAQRAAPAPAPRQFSMSTYRTLRAKLAGVVLIVAVIAALLLWLKNTVLVIQASTGTPIGLSVRTIDHVATLIQALEPYTPSLQRDASKDRYRVGLFIAPAEGSAAGRLIPIVGNQPGSAVQLAKILGSDGPTLWFDVAGIGGVDLRTGELLRPGAGRTVIEAPRSGSSPLDPTPASYLAAGLFTAPAEWLGVHSSSELERDFKPKSWLRRVVSLDDTREFRQLYRGKLEPASGEKYQAIISMTPLVAGKYLNAALLRMDDKSEALRLTDPASVLMIHTSAPGLQGTLMFVRIDMDGKVIWSVDTGIDRSHLSQILPGERSTAFVGTRPRVPDKLSEPILVIVDHRQGTMTTHSLWQ